MTAVLLGKHSLDHTPDGLVTAFAGDLSGDMVTRIMPVIGAEAVPTERMWLPVLDKVESIVGAPAPLDDEADADQDDGTAAAEPDVWAPMLDAAEAFDEADAERNDDAERAAAARVAVGRNHAPPLTYDQLGEVLAALKRWGE